MMRPITVVGGAVLSALLPCALRAQPVQFRTLALTGQQVPGQPPGVTVGFIGSTPGATPFNAAPIVVDRNGDASFSCGLIDPQASPPPGAVVKVVAGRMTVAARDGDPAPGGGVLSMLSLFNSAPSFAAGKVSFGSMVAGADLGVFTDRFGLLERALSRLDHPPGTAPGTIFFQVAHFIVAEGHILFNARYVNGSMAFPEDEGLWRNSTGQLELIALNGTPAPGTAPGVVFAEGTSLAFFGPIDMWNANAAGRVIFNGYLGGPGIDELNDEGVWIEQAAGLSLLVREGAPAPGAGPGIRFQNNFGFHTFGGPSQGLANIDINDSGDAVFGAYLDVPGSEPRNVQSIWASAGGGLTLVARRGSQPPGFDPGFTFSNAFTALSLNNNGRMILGAFVFDPPQTGSISAIWTGHPGNLTLLVREGDPIPGAPGRTFGILQALAFSESGVAVFRDSSDGAFYAADTTDHVLRIIGPGDRYEVAPGDVRTVLRAGAARGIGNSGEFAFTLEFTDATQAAVLATPGRACYPNCDASTAAPVLNVNDFVCFQNRFAAGEPYANCDGSTSPPILNVNDFVCFQARFAAGCR